jgi:hypothetical protein
MIWLRKFACISQGYIEKKNNLCACVWRETRGREREREKEREKGEREGGREKLGHVVLAAGKFEICKASHKEIPARVDISALRYKEV